MSFALNFLIIILFIQKEPPLWYWSLWMVVIPLKKTPYIVEKWGINDIIRDSFCIMN